MISGLGGRDHDSQNQLFLSLETPSKSRKTQTIQTMLFLEICESQSLQTLKWCVPEKWKPGI